MTIFTSLAQNGQNSGIEMSINNHGMAQKTRIKDGKIQDPRENFSPYWEHEIAIMTF